MIFNRQYKTMALSAKSGGAHLPSMLGASGPVRGRWAGLAWALVLGLVAACGGSRAPAADASGPDGEKSGPGGPGVPWSQKTKEQKVDWMALEVLPKTKVSFVAHDDKAYAKFQCETCHGEAMESVDFKMPNPKLYAVSPKAPVEEAKAYDEAVTTFMVDVLTPQMAALLDMQPYDAEAGQGFGCFGCHPAAAE